MTAHLEKIIDEIVEKKREEGKAEIAEGTEGKRRTREAMLRRFRREPHPHCCQRFVEATCQGRGCRGGAPPTCPILRGSTTRCSSTAYFSGRACPICMRASPGRSSRCQMECSSQLRLTESGFRRQNLERRGNKPLNPM